MLIVFDKLFRDCIHDPILHNRCQENKIRSLPSNLLSSLAEYNKKSFQEVKKIRNCHFVDYGTKMKIINFFKKHAKKRNVKF